MIPMWYFLIPYFVFAVLGFISLVVNVFHIAKFGLQSGKTSALIAVYVLAFLFVCAFTILVVFSFEWNQRIEISEAFRPNFTQGNLIDL